MEDRQARILREAVVGERELAEEKHRAARRFDAARVNAIGAEAERIEIAFGGIVGHEASIHGCVDRFSGKKKGFGRVCKSCREHAREQKLPT